MHILLMYLYMAAVAIGGDGNKDWSADSVTAEVIGNCNLDSAMFRVERDYDGRARVEMSPSTTPEHQTCIFRQLRRLSVPLRDNAPVDASAPK